jgi:hypothetical protein
MPTCQWLDPAIATIVDLLSPEECDAHVRFSESFGYADAPVTTAYGPVVAKDVRNNDRAMLDDPERAAVLWQQVRPFVPERADNSWIAVGLNERLRFYRYGAGQRFDWHYDGYFERESGERSFFTLMVYLNDDFDSGDTLFSWNSGELRPSPTLSVKPRKGMGLLFRHAILHKGDTVLRGRKYVLRTDVMYAFGESSRALSKEGTIMRPSSHGP